VLLLLLRIEKFKKATFVSKLTLYIETGKTEDFNSNMYGNQIKHGYKRND